MTVTVTHDKESVLLNFEFEQYSFSPEEARRIASELEREAKKLE